MAYFGLQPTKEFGEQFTSYLDDSLLFGDPDTRECKEVLHVMLYLCEQLGIPVTMPKLQRPATVLNILGDRAGHSPFGTAAPN